MSNEHTRYTSNKRLAHLFVYQSGMKSDWKLIPHAIGGVNETWMKHETKTIIFKLIRSDHGSISCKQTCFPGQHGFDFNPNII
jgi:hypothetical protein